MPVRFLDDDSQPTGQVPQRRLVATPTISSSGQVGFQFYNPEVEQMKESAKLGSQIELAKQKERQLNEQKLGRLRNISSFYEKELEKIPVGSGVLGGLKAQANLFAAKNIPGINPKLAAFSSMKEGSRAQLARAMGDVGNLSEVEQKAAEKLIPTGGESSEERAEKIRMLKDFVNTLVEKNSGRQLQESEPSQEQVIPQVGGVYQGSKIKKVTRIS
jgi:hypothetical protein